MHTCSTSTYPPSLVQQVWWRDRLDLQRDGAVYMVESFCSRASPTRSREGEREEGSRTTSSWRGRCEGVVLPQPSLYRGVGGCNPSPLPQAKPTAPRRRSGGARKPPF